MSTTAFPITLWLVEDNETFRRTLARALERTGEFQCTGSHASCEEALAPVKGRVPPLGTKITIIFEPQPEKKDTKAADKSAAKSGEKDKR